MKLSTHEQAKLSADYKLGRLAIEYAKKHNLDLTQKNLLKIKKLLNI